jgi:hypothetical protein
MHCTIKNIPLCSSRKQILLGANVTSLEPLNRILLSQKLGADVEYHNITG